MSSFIVGEECIGRILFGVANDGYAQRLLGLHDKDGLHRLGAEMVAMNAAGYSTRYEGRHDDDLPDIPRARFEVVTCSPVQQLKSLQCLLYQCAEGDVPERPLYKQLEEVVCHWACEIVQKLPAYDAAAWG